MTVLFEDEKSLACEARHFGRNAGRPPNVMLSHVSTIPAPRSRIWPAVAIATLAAVLATAALIVALTRPKQSVSTAPPTATYTAAEVAAAHRKLCDAYALAARAVDIETNGSNQALARIATTNGALILQNIAIAPALTSSERSAVEALAEAYRVAVAIGSSSGGNDQAWRSAVNDVNARDDQMKQICNA